MEIDPEIFKIKTKAFQIAAPLYLTLMERYLICKINHKTRRQTLASLKLSTLLKSLPLTPIEQVAKNGRDYQRAIAEPLVKNLNELKKHGLILRWGLVDEKDRPIAEIEEGQIPLNKILKEHALGDGSSNARLFIVPGATFQNFVKRAVQARRSRTLKCNKVTGN